MVTNGSNVSEKCSKLYLIYFRDLELPITVFFNFFFFHESLDESFFLCQPLILGSGSGKSPVAVV